MSFHANIHKQRSALVALYDSRSVTGILLTKGRHKRPFQTMLSQFDDIGRGNALWDGLYCWKLTVSILQQHGKRTWNAYIVESCGMCDFQQMRYLSSECKKTMKLMKSPSDWRGLQEIIFNYTKSAFQWAFSVHKYWTTPTSCTCVVHCTAVRTENAPLEWDFSKNRKAQERFWSFQESNGKHNSLLECTQSESESHGRERNQEADRETDTDRKWVRQKGSRKQINKKTGTGKEGRGRMWNQYWWGSGNVSSQNWNLAKFNSSIYFSVVELF